MQNVGFEPTKLNAVDLKSTPFDHSGNSANNNLLNSGLEPATFAL